jgi:hypothetical protein
MLKTLIFDNAPAGGLGRMIGEMLENSQFFMMHSPGKNDW